MIFNDIIIKDKEVRNISLIAATAHLMTPTGEAIQPLLSKAAKLNYGTGRTIFNLVKVKRQYKHKGSIFNVRSRLLNGKDREINLIIDSAQRIKNITTTDSANTSTLIDTDFTFLSQAQDLRPNISSSNISGLNLELTEDVYIYAKAGNSAQTSINFNIKESVTNYADTYRLIKTGLDIEFIESIYSYAKLSNIIKTGVNLNVIHSIYNYAKLSYPMKIGVNSEQYVIGQSNFNLSNPLKISSLILLENIAVNSSYNIFPPVNIEAAYPINTAFTAADQICDTHNTQVDIGDTSDNIFAANAIVIRRAILSDYDSSLLHDLDNKALADLNWTEV